MVSLILQHGASAPPSAWNTASVWVPGLLALIAVLVSSWLLESRSKRREHQAWARDARLQAHVEYAQAWEGAYRVASEALLMDPPATTKDPNVPLQTLRMALIKVEFVGNAASIKAAKQALHTLAVLVLEGRDESEWMFASYEAYKNAVRSEFGLAPQEELEL